MTDEDEFDYAVMVRANSIENAKQLGLVWMEAVKLYTDSGDIPPPTPSNLNKFPPCSLLISDRNNINTGLRIGRVQFYRPDDSCIYDQEWVISGG